MSDPVLVLKVCSATGLNKHNKSSSRISCILNDNEETKYQTRFQVDVENPIWNEEFSIPIPNYDEDVINITLLGGSESKPKVLSDSIELRPRKFAINGAPEIWEKVMSRKGNDVCTLRCEVQVRQDSAAQPNFVSGNVKIDINILKAVGLIGEKGQSIDPYVKVSLRTDPKQKFKTKVIKNSSNPEWNETFFFDVRNLSEEAIFVTLKSKGKTRNQTLMNRLKISFKSFEYGETKQITKEIHKKDQLAGTLYLSIHCEDEQAAQSRDANLTEVEKQSKKDKKSTSSVKSQSSKHDFKSMLKGMCFHVVAVDAAGLTGNDNYSVKIKMKTDDKAGEVITTEKQGPEPVWNEDMFIKTKNAQKDKLCIYLLKNGKPCINTVHLNTNQYTVGQKTIVWEDDVFDTKKKVGHLKLLIDPLEYDQSDQIIKQFTKDAYDLKVHLIDCSGYSQQDEPLTVDFSINNKNHITSSQSQNFEWDEHLIVPFNSFHNDVLTVRPSKGGPIAITLNRMTLNSINEYNEDVPNTDDCYIHFTLQPVEHVRPQSPSTYKKREIDVNNTRKDAQDCKFQLGSYSSLYTTTFSSLPSSFKGSLSSLRSSEEAEHAHEPSTGDWDYKGPKPVDPHRPEKPCRYDNVSGSLTGLAEIVEIGNNEEVYATLDVISLSREKKKETIKSSVVDNGEVPALEFNLEKIKKGNTLVLAIWKKTDHEEFEVGVCKIPIRDIPDKGQETIMDFNLEKPASFSKGHFTSFGKAALKLTHSVNYMLPS